MLYAPILIIRTCKLEPVIGFRAGDAGSRLFSGGMPAGGKMNNMLGIESDVRDES